MVIGETYNLISNKKNLLFHRLNYQTLIAFGKEFIPKVHVPLRSFKRPEVATFHILTKESVFHKNPSYGVSSGFEIFEVVEPVFEVLFVVKNITFHLI